MAVAKKAMITTIVEFLFLVPVACIGFFLLVYSAGKKIKGFSAFVKKFGWLCIVVAILVASWLSLPLLSSRSLENCARLFFQVLLLELFGSMLFSFILKAVEISRRRLSRRLPTETTLPKVNRRLSGKLKPASTHYMGRDGSVSISCSRSSLVPSRMMTTASPILPSP